MDLKKRQNIGKVIQINDWQQKLSKLVTEKLLAQYPQKDFYFGFFFKANTNDTRESPAIYICKDLIEEGKSAFMIQELVKKN